MANVPQQTGGMVDELIEDDKDVDYSTIPDTDTSTIEASDDTKQEPVVDDDTPEELKGKTQAELAKMYREAQSLIGRQGSELGELRKLADTAIRTTLAAQQGRQTAQPKQEADPVKAPDEVDFYADPKKAMEAAIAAHPELKKLRGQAQQFAAIEITRRKGENQALFNSEFADVSETLADPKFREWVGKSKVRQALLKRADAMYDLDAAREVLGTWREIKEAGAPAAAAAANAVTAGKDAAKRAARVPTGGNASRGEGAGAKIYRRSEILELMTNNPAKYDQLADEIALAYQQNRVR